MKSFLQCVKLINTLQVELKVVNILANEYIIKLRRKSSSMTSLTKSGSECMSMATTKAQLAARWIHKLAYSCGTSVQAAHFGKDGETGVLKQIKSKRLGYSQIYTSTQYNSVISQDNELTKTRLIGVGWKRPTYV